MHLFVALCFLLQNNTAHDPGPELHSSKDAGHQGRTASAQGTGVLCPCQTPSQGLLHVLLIVFLYVHKTIYYIF